MIRTRRWLLATVVLLALAQPREARAAAEVHRFNLVLSANPGAIFAKDFNDRLGDYNRIVLESRGLEPLGTINFAWLFQGEFRYLVRQNIAVGLGAGTIESSHRNEYLPRIGQSINLETSVKSTPIHAGATYYLAPYNQGDFQARAYLGAGVLSLTNNSAVLSQRESATDSATTLGGTFRAEGTRDSPGYYAEFGGHMFFASRYSVMLGVLYRGAMIRDMVVVLEETNATTGEVTVSRGEPFDLDMSGLSLRLGVAIGF